MSSRIIRGDGRSQKLKISPSGSMNDVSNDHIMDVEKQAFEQGYAEGERTGKQMGEAMVETVCKRYEKSIVEFVVSHKEMAKTMEEQTVQIALEIARKIVQRELTMDPDLITALAVVALKRLSGHQSISLRVSTSDFERVRVAIGQINPAVTVKDDTGLERGDFVIETGQTHLDGRVANQIDTIGRALLDE